MDYSLDLSEYSLRLSQGLNRLCRSDIKLLNETLTEGAFYEVSFEFSNYLHDHHRGILIAKIKMK